MRKNIFWILIVFAAVLIIPSCGKGETQIPSPENIVPKREVLIENLEKSGYGITALTAVEGSDLTVDRVMAEKGGKFIDIVYGLSGEDAGVIFELYCGLYPDGYYILAQNGNNVYCVSDKKTFSKAGFTSTGNVGVQYINN